jgi:hypothetical protein
MLDRYYYMASLPALGELGTEAPMGFCELLEHLSDSRPRYELVASLFLLDDLMQREAFLAGEIEEVDPAVLSIQQARNEGPLPESLAGDSVAEAKGALGVAADRLWDAYFRYVFGVAQRRKSEFLRAWVTFEVTLRNALVAARSKRLGLDGSEYFVATDLVGSDDELAGLVGEWAAAATPLAGQQVLLRGRWAWLDENDAWFSFRDDELAAYAARLMLLRQWERIAAEGAGR